MKIDFSEEIATVTRQIRGYQRKSQSIPKGVLEYYNLLITSSPLPTSNTGTSVVHNGTQSLGITRHEIISDTSISLSTEDSVFQHAVVAAGILTFNLPSNPEVNTHFVFKNSFDSVEPIYIDSFLLSPGEIYEIIYDGVEWTIW
jgi:hypothetical protein